MSAADDLPFSRLTPGQQAIRALIELVRDHPWPTRMVTAWLAVLAVVGTCAAALEQPLSRWLGLPETVVGVERALTSDPFLTLLALLTALLVGIAIKRRQLLGQLDGTDHYTIGRALAYGYFKNFLVGALLVMEARGSRLHVVKPASVDDLKTLENELWPALQPELNVRTEEVAAVARYGSKPLRRRIILLEGWGAAADPLYIDFPTTLFTMADYYASWNRWALRNDRPAIGDERLAAYQQQQINDFFRQLHEMVHSQDGEVPVGVEAVAEHGLSAERLQALFRDRLVEISLDQLRARLADRPPERAA
ncbi:MAG: STING domain-containing protein [Hydrogenophaga sp.]